jgi:UDP-glucose 4-epimerase
MRVLISGGFGFIGGRIAARLVQSGHRVILGSRNVSRPTSWLTKSEVMQIEWDDDRALEHCCNGVDVVIQAAGMNAQDCAHDPVGALSFNGVATARLVAAASRARVRRFIYLSTAHVYANPLIGAITEENFLSNLHPYATSHLAGEHAVLSANQQGHIRGIVLRLSNAFGAPMHENVNCWTLLVNDLCKQAVQTRKLVLKTSGLQHRDFVDLSEVCRVAEYFAMGNGDTLSSSIFNVGGVSQTVFEMALLIQRRAERILGFQPSLYRQKEADNVLYPKLNYRSDRLVAAGVMINDKVNNSAEIDELLYYCL